MGLWERGVGNYEICSKLLRFVSFLFIYIDYTQVSKFKNKVTFESVLLTDKALLFHIFLFNYITVDKLSF